MKSLLHILGIFLFAALLASCQKYEVIGPEEEVKDLSTKRTILITDEVEEAEMEADKQGSKRELRSIVLDDDDTGNDGITDDDDDDSDTEEAQDKKASY